MKTRHLPRAAGIYQIENTRDGKTYIGSAVDIQVRLHLHRRALLRNEHTNRRLQHAWNKHGYDAFAASVLQLVADKSDLVSCEQRWIDALRPAYNIRSVAASNLGLKWDQESRDRGSRIRAKPMQGFITPDGGLVTILNLGMFCRANGLSTGAMRQLAAGTATSHKGWTHTNAKKREREWKKTYEGFIDPDGTRVGPITNLEAFCRERGLIASNMSKVYHGKKPSHRGWTHVRSLSRWNEPKTVTVYEGFINPQGERVTITNLTKYCRDNGLDHATMYRLIQGKAKQHKGWRYEGGAIRRIRASTGIG